MLFQKGADDLAVLDLLNGVAKNKDPIWNAGREKRLNLVEVCG